MAVRLLSGQLVPSPILSVFKRKQARTSGERGAGAGPMAGFAYAAQSGKARHEMKTDTKRQLTNATQREADPQLGHMTQVLILSWWRWAHNER